MPRKGERKIEMPSRDGKGERTAGLSQGSPSKSEHDALSQRDPNKGAFTCDPGGRLTGEESIALKWPLRPRKRPRPNHNPGCTKVKSDAPPPATTQPRTWQPFTIVPSHRREANPSLFWSPYRGRGVVQDYLRCSAALMRPRPRTCMTLALARPRHSGPGGGAC